MVTHDDREQKPAIQGPVRDFGRRPGRSAPLFVAPHPRDYTGFPAIEALHLAKPNYSFEKRQREIAKKKEKDEKDARKREAREAAKLASGSGEASTDESSDASKPD